MDKEVLVSVFCLAYNHEKYIRDALDSFLMQKTNFKYEILVHDDASTDGTAGIIREYEKKYPDLIKPVYQTENKHSSLGGLGLIFQYLCPIASGKYYALCEGDDYWTDPNKLQKQFDFLETNQDYSMCVHRGIWHDCPTSVSTHIFPKQENVGDYSTEEIIDPKYFLLTASTFVRSAVYQSMPEEFRTKQHGDIFTRVYASTLGKIRCLDDVMGVYNYRSFGSYSEKIRSTDKAFSIQRNRAVIEMYQKLDELLGLRSPESIQKRIRSAEYHLNKHLGNLDVIQRPEYDEWRINDIKRKEKEARRARMIRQAERELPPYDEFCSDIKELWNDPPPTHEDSKSVQLETALGEYLNVPYLAVFAERASALHAALTVLDLPKGGAVITSPYADTAVLRAIVSNGLTPVFCDVNETDFNLDVTKLEAMIDEKTCVIMPLYTLGNICIPHEIRNIADRYNLKVLCSGINEWEAMSDNNGSVSFGDMSVFSLKTGVVGGGMVICNSYAQKTKLDHLKAQGVIGGEAVYISEDSVMNNLQAAMILSGLNYTTENLEKKRAVANRYRERLANQPGFRLLESTWSNHSRFPIILDAEMPGIDRSEIIKQLDFYCIRCGAPFKCLAYEQPCYKPFCEGDKSTPVAKDLKERTLLLPMYSKLSIEDVDYVCDVLLDCVAEQASKKQS